MELLLNKTMLVTGGARGIGAAIVRMAMQEGAHVAFTYLNSSEESRSIEEEMSDRFPGQRCLARKCDVADWRAMQALVDSLISDFGRMDALVNNAGIARDSVLARMSPEQWESVISTNLGGLYSATRPLILQMVKQRGGSIINISSTVGIYGNSGQTNYAAAKAGMIGFTRALSAEVAPHGVRVNAVAPGFIHTDMMGLLDQETLEYYKSRVSLRRLGTVDDVASMVCFLASNSSSYITGQVIQVDGGITL
jgi:3-oxoacyl-[acyl-carrier protein] reductase